MSCHKVQRCFQLTSLGKWLNNNATSGILSFEGIMHSIKHYDIRHAMTWQKITRENLCTLQFFSIRIFWMMKWHSSDVCIKPKAFNFCGIFLYVYHNKLVWQTVVAMVTFDGHVLLWSHLTEHYYHPSKIHLILLNTTFTLVTDVE